MVLSMIKPSKASSRKAKKLIEELSLRCREYVQKDLLKKLEKRIEDKLGSKQSWRIVIDEEDNDEQTILFYYPQVTNKKESYIKPAVKIEIGARSEHWPVSLHKIEPYVANTLPDTFKNMSAEIKVLNVERTFWEKATILHLYAHYPEGKIVPVRQSRHYYDFYCLLTSPVKEKALLERELLQRVCEHKKLYFKAAWAKYEEAQNGNLKVIPPSFVAIQLEKDYGEMKDMFYGEIVSWRKIMQEITKFQL